MPNVVFTIENNYTHYEGDSIAIQIIRDHLTILDPNRFFKESYKKGYWDGRFVLYDRKSNKFLTGLLSYVCAKIDRVTNGLVENFIKYEIIDTRVELKPMNSSWELPGVEMREYQVDAIKAVINSPIKGRGTIHAAVNAGKTEIFAALANYYGRKTLMITPNYSPLAVQTYERFKKRGLENTSIYRESEDALDSAIVVSNIQLLHARKDKLKEFFESVEVLLIDEVHAAEADSYKGVILACENAYIKIGASGSPYRGDTYGDLLLIGLVGHIIYKISSKELMDKGFSSSVDVAFLEYSDGEFPICHDSYADYYIKMIVQNETRNALIVDTVKKIYDFGDKGMVFTKSVEHCEALTERLINAGVSAVKVDGSVDNRNELKLEFERGNIKCIVATTVFNWGIDFAGGVDYLINASSGISEVANIQKSGRGQRLKKDGYNRCLLIDFQDDCKYFSEHSETRKDLYKREEYNVKQVKSDEFDEYLGEYYKKKIEWLENSKL